MKTILSIIIPVYNAGKYLNQCLRSILNGAGEGFEVILIDDGSTDGSSELCRTWAEKDERIIFKRQPNAGVSVARNVGLSLCNGKYAVFIDADDFVDPGFVDAIREAILTAVDCEIIRFGYRLVTENGAIIREFPIKKYGNCTALLADLSKGLDCERLLIVAYAFRIDLIKKNGIEFTTGCRYGEDQEFTHELLMHAESLFTLDKAYYNYRQYSGNTMKKATLDQLAYVQAIDRVAGYYGNLPGRDERVLANYREKFIPAITAESVFFLLSRGVAWKDARLRLESLGLARVAEGLKSYRGRHAGLLRLCMAFPLAGRILSGVRRFRGKLRKGADK